MSASGTAGNLDPADLWESVVQGFIAVLVEATISAVVEPVVNRILVKRMSIRQALRELDARSVARFWKTTVITDFIKMPTYEVIFAAFKNFSKSTVVSGLVVSLIFTGVTLPLTNFRFRKSMQLEITWATMYEAFVPTVLRAVISTIARAQMELLVPLWTIDLPASAFKRVVDKFIPVFSGTALSSPGNELRGYYLQSPDKAIPFSKFFVPSKMVRSSVTGCLSYSFGLSFGALFKSPGTPKMPKEKLDCQALLTQLFVGVALFWSVTYAIAYALDVFLFEPQGQQTRLVGDLLLSEEHAKQECSSVVELDLCDVESSCDSRAQTDVLSA